MFAPFDIPADVKCSWYHGVTLERPPARQKRSCWLVLIYGKDAPDAAGNGLTAREVRSYAMSQHHSNNVSWRMWALVDFTLEVPLWCLMPFFKATLEWGGKEYSVIIVGDCRVA